MKLFTLSLLATGVAMSIGGASLAQGTQQTIPVLKTDVVRVATGFRASKIIGESVVNDANETVGKVDDIIVADGKAPFLILSVGGFLGMGNKLVAVPHEALKVHDKKLVLPGATKDTLKDLPEFKYAKD
jgi:hypothetical protein